MAALPPGPEPAIWVVGDIQGCAAELDLLLQRCAFDSARDQLWCVGDLVNRGPDSLAVLRRLMALGPALRTVLGNHDLHLLARAAGVRPAGRLDTLDQVLAAPDLPELMDWLRHQPLLHLDQDHQALMVHAGIPGSWSPAKAQVLAGEVEQVLQADNWREQLGALFGNAPKRWDDSLQGAARQRCVLNHLTRMRSMDAAGNLLLSYSGPLKNLPAGAVPWWQHRHPDSDGWTLLFGHWAALAGAPATPQLQALDAGCVWGGELVALRLQDLVRVTVPALPTS